MSNLSQASGCRRRWSKLIISSWPRVQVATSPSAEYEIIVVVIAASVPCVRCRGHASTYFWGKWHVHTWIWCRYLHVLKCAGDSLTAVIQWVFSECLLPVYLKEQSHKSQPLQDSSLPTSTFKQVVWRKLFGVCAEFSEEAENQLAAICSPSERTGACSFV